MWLCSLTRNTKSQERSQVQKSIHIILQILIKRPPNLPEDFVILQRETNGTQSIDSNKQMRPDANIIGNQKDKPGMQRILFHPIYLAENQVRTLCKNLYK